MPDLDHPRPPRAAWPARLLAAASVAYACVLAWATHHPKPEDLLGRNPPSDKLVHVGAYTVLAALVAATLAAAGRLSPRGMRIAAVSLAAFAVVDEATQPLPWFRRTADPLDWIFDVVGIAIGMAAVAGLVALMRRRARCSDGRQ